MLRIVSVLPEVKGLPPRNFGEIATCVRDFTCRSCYRNEIEVLGGVNLSGFDIVRYEVVPSVKRYEGSMHAYASGCAKIINDKHARLVEIHNHPHFLHLMAGRVKCRLALHLYDDPQEMDAARTPDERHRLLEICSAVYCATGYIRNRFMEGLNKKLKKKLHVVYTGAEYPGSLPEKENIIVFVGNMTEGRGAKVLAQALRIALPDLREWRAVFISSTPPCADEPGLYEERVKQILSPLGRRAKMLGFLSRAEIRDYLARSAIAVALASRRDPLEYSVFEAMACGCALISSGRGGLREITGIAAVTLKDFSIQRLADTITMLAKDPKERARLQGLAREHHADSYISRSESTKGLDRVREQILG